MDAAPSVADERETRILDAAFAKFSAYGFARTSMADIAEAAGMSRPALYQYFANKEDILTAVLGRALDHAADVAIGALGAGGALEVQLDGFLQGWSGDLYEALMTTEHGDDLVEAKAGHARSRVEAVNARIRKAVASHLAAHTGLDARSPELVDLVDVLLLGPLGFKQDAPTVARFRRRLAELAKTVATRAERAVGVA